MRRLRVGNRLLAAVLLALGARLVVSGLTFASGLSCAVVGALLLMSLLLTRYGQRFEPPIRPLARGGQPPPRPAAPQPSRQSRAMRGRRRN